MRIAYIAAGAAGMYCGSCLHDNTLAAALLDLGEDIVLVPTYTPLRTDEVDVSRGRRVFFGGINVYLQQRFPIFRFTPWWLDRILDYPLILNSVGGRAGSVDPSRLGDLTVSMLRGEDGHQRKELEKLAHWLLAEFRPDVIHLSNSMLLGMVRMLSRNCGPPIICALSGEDIFLERLVAPYYEQARTLLRERARDVHAFTALNSFYADMMGQYLAVDRGRVHVIPHGLNLDGHGTRPTQSGNTFAIGYLARICEEKGLHLLVEACEILAQDGSLPPFELRVAGYLGQAERRYLRGLRRRVATGPLAGRFRYHGELDLAAKLEFLQSLDAFSVPTSHPEAKGLPALEALANAVPVVLPAHGSYPELVADTGGGLTCRPHDAKDLAARLADLLRDPEKAADFGRTGQAAVRERYHAPLMARRTQALYRQLIAELAV